MIKKIVNYSKEIFGQGYDYLKNISKPKEEKWIWVGPGKNPFE